MLTNVISFEQPGPGGDHKTPESGKKNPQKILVKVQKLLNVFLKLLAYLRFENLTF